MDPFAFARGKNLLHQLLDSVVVHRVGVDVAAELVKVPSLLTKTSRAGVKSNQTWLILTNRFDVHLELVLRKPPAWRLEVLPQGPERGDSAPVRRLSLLSRSLERSFQSSAQTFCHIFYFGALLRY